VCRIVLSSVLTVFLVFFCLASASFGQFYKWTDKDGTIHYSDNPADVPDFSAGQESTDAQSKEQPLKNGWDQDNLDQAISGCTYGMMDSSMKSYRQRALDKGHQVTDDEIQKVQSRLYPILHKTCRCVFEKVSRKFTFEQVTQDSPGSKRYIKSLMEKNACPLPVPSR